MLINKIWLLKDRLFEPVHPISIGLFRIGFGIVLLFNFIRIKSYIIDNLTHSKFFLKYDLFTWVSITSPENLEILFLVLKTISCLFILGFLYRIVTIGLFFGWGYIFLLDVGHYNNHYYLYLLVLFLMIFIRADRWGSLNNLIFKKSVKSIPLWNLWILQFQIVVAYFYGGIAKLDMDWFQGYPMKLWLSNYNGLIGTDGFALFISYAGLIFDLSIGFLLLFKKTRIWAIFPVLVFHISNHFFWNIGTFPFFSILGIILFFPPVNFLRFFPHSKELNQQSEIKHGKFIKLVLITYILIQLVLPLRPFFYRDKAAWNGYGQTFSWRMMLHSREHAGKIKVVIPHDHYVGYVDIGEYLNYRQYARLIRQPKFAVEFGRFIGNTLLENGADDVEIYGYFWKSVNARPYQLLLDTSLNLMNIPDNRFAAFEYIYPMKNSNLGLSIDTMEYNEFIQKFQY